MEPEILDECQRMHDRLADSEHRLRTLRHAMSSHTKTSRSLSRYANADLHAMGKRMLTM